MPMELEANAVADALPCAMARSWQKTFARDVMLFASANLLYLGITAVTTFVLPRVVSVRTFGLYRLFLLFAGYVGILHIGTLDGALVRWADDPTTRIRREVPAVVVFMSLVELAILFPACLIAFIVANRIVAWMLLAIAIIALATNATSLGQYVLQAAKRFRRLSLLTVLMPAVLLLSVIGLAVAHRADTLTVVSAALFTNLVIAIGYAISVRGQIDWKWPSAAKAWGLAKIHIHIGFAIMLTNFFANLIVSADRLFVTAKFSIENFAIYSFAGTIFYSVNLMVLSVSKVVFPYLVRDIAHDRHNVAFRLGHKTVLALWSLGMASYFPLHWLVLRILPKYASSLPLIRILIIGTGASALVQILHFNFFRVYHLGRRMLVGTIIGLVMMLGILFTVQSYGKMDLLAMGMVAGVTCWWAANEVLLRDRVERSGWAILLDLSLMVLVAGGYIAASSRVSLFNCGLYFIGACGFTWWIIPRSAFNALKHRLTASH